ncbi:hypothetical protein K502DRAFT_359879 [Neoconidiobolus thromboides FSU 785]|nr:hypothetical protein K502DRAFT_359879 [Neoconidiobolus thromboides FSU 785]
MRLIYLHCYILIYSALRQNMNSLASIDTIENKEKGNNNNNNNNNKSNDRITDDLELINNDILPKPVLVSTSKGEKNDLLPTSSLSKPNIFESKPSSMNNVNNMNINDNQNNNNQNNNNNNNNNNNSPTPGPTKVTDQNSKESGPSSSKAEDSKCKSACKGLADSNPSEMLKCYTECVGQPGVLLVPSNVTLPSAPTSLSKKSKESDVTFVTFSKKKTNVVNNSKGAIIISNYLVYCVGVVWGLLLLPSI